MPRQLIYDGIGSHETPDPVKRLMMDIGKQLAESGWLLRSGRATGADQAFEMGAIMGGGKKEIFLPWEGFEKAPRNHPDYIVPDFTPDLHDYAASFHPNWGACSQGTKLLHMRNCCQVMGRLGDAPADVVICWTKGGKRNGGTGQALRIAEFYQIPIFDLGLPDPDVLRRLCDTVNRMEQENQKGVLA